MVEDRVKGRRTSGLFAALIDIGASPGALGAKANGCSARGSSLADEGVELEPLAAVSMLSRGDLRSGSSGRSSTHISMSSESEVRIAERRALPTASSQL